MVNRELIIALTAKYGVPAIYYLRLFPDSGGLISYGDDRDELFRQAAGYIDRILKGAKPADLPLQTPTKYELVINLKTAKALGLDVSLHASTACRRSGRMRWRCPLLAQSGHAELHCTCPLSG